MSSGVIYALEKRTASVKFSVASINAIVLKDGNRGDVIVNGTMEKEKTAKNMEKKNRTL